MGDIFVVTGPPGSGKSTVAARVVQTFGSSVLVDAECFVGFWRSGAIPSWLAEARPQAAVAEAAAAAAAGVFAGAGCWVVYDGELRPDDLPAFAAAAGGAAVHYAVLLPPVEACLDRVASRGADGLADARATLDVYRDFADARLPDRHLVTDPDGEPQDVAAAVRERLDAGDFAWAPDGRSAQAAEAVEPPD